MAVVKNKTTERDKQFWAHIEAVAAQVRGEAKLKIDTERGGNEKPRIAAYPSV